MFSLLSKVIVEKSYIWSLPFENNFILWFQSLGGEGSFIYYLMNILSMLGEELVLVAIVGLIYWGFDKRVGERLGFTMITATLLVPLVKNIVKRARPFNSGSGIQNFRDESGYSFPSGHSAGSSSTLVGAAVYYKEKKYKWLIAIAVVVPLLVALSRTYVGAHYPTDVVCGLALGVGVVFLMDWLFKIVPNKYWLYGGMLLIGFVGFFYCTTSDFFTSYGILLGFVGGIFFEENFTKFENTRVWWRIVLRVLVGGALFLGLNEGLKAVIGVIFPNYQQMIWFERIFRTIRYAFVVLIVIGVYPLLFAQTEKLWIKLGWIKKIKTENSEETPTEEQAINEESATPATESENA